jgi:hypothetical protein
LDAYEALLAEIDKFLEKGVDKYKFKERKKKSKSPAKKKQLGQSKATTVANLSAPVKENSLLTVDKRAPRTSAIIPIINNGLRQRMTSSKSLMPTQLAKPDLPKTCNDEQT